MGNTFNRFVSYFFFSNIFLGITAVALCIETNFTSNLSLNYFPFYIVIFLGTCLYYTTIYVRNVSAVNYNERTLWYRRNLSYVSTTLKYMMAALFLFVLIILFRNRHHLSSLIEAQWALLLFFPLLVGWYTFSPRIFRLKNIRQLGTVKPFIIGLTWSGFVSVYPVFVWQIQKAPSGDLPLFPSVFLWLQNFLFISILAIIFDIKDYRSDAFHQLKTFPVLFGIKKTLYRVAFPLLLLNLVVFSVAQIESQQMLSQTILKAVPYILLMIMIFRSGYQKQLLYYLAGIDGLMLLKALCGIAATLLFK